MIPSDDWPELVERYASGSLRGIAREYGVSHEAVRRTLDAARSAGAQSVSGLAFSQCRETIHTVGFRWLFTWQVIALTIGTSMSRNVRPVDWDCGRHGSPGVPSHITIG